MMALAYSVSGTRASSQVGFGMVELGFELGFGGS